MGGALARASGGKSVRATANDMTGCSPLTGIVAARWHPLCRQSPQGFWLSPSSACVASENKACSATCAISAMSLGAHATTIPTRNKMIASAKKASRADRRRASRRNAGWWRRDMKRRLAARCRVTQFQSSVFVQQGVQIRFGHADHQRYLDWKLGRTGYPPDLAASGRVNAEEAKVPPRRPFERQAEKKPANPFQSCSP